MKVKNTILCFAAMLIAPLTVFADPITESEPPNIHTLRDALFHTPTALKDRVFNPERFFSGPRHDIPKPDISALYLGDDYNWPVWAMALKKNCTYRKRTKDRDQFKRPIECVPQWTARVMRAPGAVYNPINPEAPEKRMRNYGSEFAASVYRISRENPDLYIEQIVEKQGIEWLEADLRACPEAIEILGEFSKLQWVSDAFDTGDHNFYRHADTVSLTYNSPDDSLTYKGVPDDQNPAEWAVTLYQAVEPCLKPSKALLPWRAIKPD